MRRFVVTVVVSAVVVAASAVGASPSSGDPAPAPDPGQAAPSGSADPWTLLDAVPQPKSAASRSYLEPKEFQALALDDAALAGQLAGVPSEPAPGVAPAGGGTELSLPTPSGDLARFRVAESPVMDPALAAKYPDIRTYRGQGIDDPAATVRFDRTPVGFHAQVLSPDGAWYIDPYFHLETSAYVSYYGRDLTRSDGDRYEELGHLPGWTPPTASPPSVERSGTQLRTHRAAFAASGEYTAFYGGTVNGAMAGLVTTVNRLDQVYESEVAVRMVLVADNDELIFTNAGTDPYVNSCDDADTNQTVVDDAIGSANYDIGHVVTTASGGCAYLGVVGVDGWKAKGTTGTFSPVGDAFDIDYVAHEVGHQYGGDHTFNGTRGSCNGNAEPSTAYEPGSGITIQAYAGICGLDDLAKVNAPAGASDPYFHSVSFDQIVTHTTAGNPGDIGATATGNTVPTASAGADGAIPARTPFLLRGSGTDANGDTLTYTWEQRDLGAQRTLDNPQMTAGPLFRWRPPITSGTRYLPQMASVIGGNTNVSPGGCGALTGTIGLPQQCWSELLPTSSRNLNFRLTVRDNRSGGGGVNTDDLVVGVTDTGSPFAVTSQATAVSYAAGSTQTVTWDVAGTTAAPINAALVDILLSTDGGQSFPQVVATGVANDGNQTVTIPNAATTTGRIMVVQSGAGNGARFFDVNGGVVTITAAATGLLRVTTNPPLAADIIVDGIARDTWGLNWAEFPVGSHQVCFGDVPTYTKPACQDVTVDPGATTTVVGNYTKNGWLRVQTDPPLPATVVVDGTERNDWGIWAEVVPGTYTVCFGDVADYTTPSCRDVVVSSNATATTTGTFTANPGAPGPSGTFGYLRATTSPANDAMIYVDGEWMDNWGLTWVKVVPGAHQVCFGPSRTLVAPASCSDVNVTVGATTEVVGSYTQRAYLRVQTSPPVGGTITVDGQVANAWGVWTSKPPGTYDVCFGEVPGYSAPPCQNDVSVIAGNTATVTGTYAPLP